MHNSNLYKNKAINIFIELEDNSDRLLKLKLVENIGTTNNYNIPEHVLILNKEIIDTASGYSRTGISSIYTLTMNVNYCIYKINTAKYTPEDLEIKTPPTLGKKTYSPEKRSDFNLYNSLLDKELNEVRMKRFDEIKQNMSLKHELVKCSYGSMNDNYIVNINSQQSAYFNKIQTQERLAELIANDIYYDLQ